MKTVTVLVASCFAHFSADAFDNRKNTPVGKVITVLQDNLSQLEQESEEDEGVYQTMGCWCETNDKEQTQAIAGAEQWILDLTSAIDELGAKSSHMKIRIQNLEEELEKNSEALNSATALRKKQLAELNEEEKGMLQSISGLKSAVVVMSKQFGESAAYFQDSSVTLGLAAMLDKELRIHQDLLREVITPKQRRLVEAFAKDPHSFLQMHTPTEELYGVLKQMKESFQTNLAASQREEAENQHAYEELKVAKEDEIFAGRSQVDTKTEELAMTDTKHAQRRQDLQDTQNTLSSDTKFLADLKERCASVDAEYEMRTKSRRMEMQATSKALEFLSSDEAHELFGKTLALVQRSRLERRTLRSHVASLLHQARRRTGDPRHGALEVHARLDASGKIKKSVQDMIDMLIQEKDDEIKHRAFCIDALNTNERDTENKERDKSDMQAKIKDLKMSIDETTKAIEELTAEIAEMQLQMKHAGEDREKENRDFQLTIRDQRATQKLLGAALGVLKGFYDKAALLQQAESAVAVSESQRQAPAPPSFKPMEKSAAGGGVMGMIQKIIRDASAMEAEALRAEEDSQKGYVEFARNTNDSIEEKSKYLLNKEEEKAKLEQELVESKEGAATIMQEMEQLFNADADLHKSCDFILKNSEDRTTARDSEVDALKESLAMFSVASDAALLQGHPLLLGGDKSRDRPFLFDGQPLEKQIQWYPPPRRQYSRRELFADQCVNFTGAVLAWVGAAALSYISWRYQDGAVKQWGFLAYGLGLILMLNLSAYYHYAAWDWQRTQQLKSLDHIGISAMIMGSYAPIMIKCESYRVLLFVCVMGFLGFSIEVYRLMSDMSSAEHWTYLDWVNLARYLTMGWACVVIMPHMSRILSTTGFYTCIAGGVLYTVGVLFLISEELEFHLTIWHLFVLGGSFCFYFFNVLELAGGQPAERFKVRTPDY